MLFFANILQPLISVFETVIKFFHNNLGVGWGLSIVLLTVLVRAFLVPLTVKQYRSMQALQAHQPELKALQAKYKDDKQRLNQEIMKFYKENKVNPLGSCLPLLAQFPVFISLYYLLRSDLRGYICPTTQTAYKLAHHTTATVACGVHNGAQFLFIPDLTNKATGAVLIVLMVLYVGSQLFSSLMMSTSAMDPTQRKIMILMPLVFVFLFISFPAGVILYWITTNLWTIVQQLIVRRIVGPPPVPATAKASGDGGGSSGGDGGTKSSVRKPQPRGPKPTTDPAPSASSAAKSAVGGLLRRRLEPAPEPSGARGSSRTGPPPPSPRKKKKRSGRRR
ncbi:MAG TPA: YidC/Oxa1 family membrane protein insertase [Solirubrobacteraceae bacterium]|nr:YidC/Oxa1 family membrane protein insertase [Solirubrobacteraceae bacterium]